MLIFHEGLPGSGKSYETLVQHIIPSLKKGRKVYARINGLNFEKIASLAEITEEECKELLHQITEEQVHEIPKLVTNDSLVVIDELQNFFPSGRGKVADDMTQFVTEHRHRGLDLVVMGQSIADVHNLWRRRTERKIQFLKMSMIGADNRYKWTAFQGSLDAKGEIRFTQIKSGVKKYDSQYFGSYLSHQASTENTDSYQDARLNIFNTSFFKVVLPAFVLIFGYAVYYLIGFFSGDSEMVDSEALKKQQNEQVVKTETKPVQIKDIEAKRAPIPESLDFLQSNERRFTSRITYIEQYGVMIWDMIVIWVDDGDRLHDRLYRDDILAMGYTLKWVGYGVQATKGDYTTVFRMRPAPEPVGRVSNNISSQIISSD
tara:strand:- start:2015 stop:3136 length:1122 start_codon:yes stop_codon:yes gene_type:complete